MLKFGSKLLLGVLVVVLFLTLVQCTVKKPESPTWTTGATVPVINRTYGMQEIVSKIDQDGISMDSAGNVIFSISEQIDTMALSQDLLSTADLSIAVGQAIGEVTINTPSINPVSVSISSIAGLATGLPGDSAAVSPMSFTVSNTPPVINEFSEATIASATAYAVVGNELGIDLDQVNVELFDIDRNRVVTSQAIPGGLPHGTIDSVLLPLSGETVSNNLTLRAICHTNGGIVDSASYRYVDTDVDFVGDITVSYGLATIPGFTENRTQQIDLQESNRIDSASISSGTLRIDLTNETELTSHLDITLPDLYWGSQPVTIARDLAPRQTRSVTIDLAGHFFRPNDLTLPQSISVDLVATVSGSAVQVPVYSTDSFYVDASLQNVQFASVSGDFDGTVNTFGPIAQAIDIPLGFDAITLTNAILTVDIANGVNLPGSLSAVIVGDNGKQLPIGGHVSVGSPANPVTTTITNSDVADFLSPIPSNITVSGNVVFEDGTASGTITSNDFVVGTVGIVSPLDIIIDSTTFTSDIEKTDIDTSNIDAITDHVIEAHFLYEIANHLPIGATVSLAFSGDSATLYSNPELLIDAMMVGAAPVSIDGIVQGELLSGLQEIALDSVDVQVLNNDPLYIGPVITLEGSNGQVVRFTQNDYITISGVVEVEYRFDGDF
jgi:hypothetical protein